jgi:hypothetical protein
MPERKPRKSRGKCLVWRDISTCKPQRSLLAKSDFVVKMGTAQTRLFPIGMWPFELGMLICGEEWLDVGLRG